jgi:hypothetical protein
MSAEVAIPLPRGGSDELHSQPVDIQAVGGGVALGCSGCRAELRVPLEPVAPLLDAVGDFVRQHAPCQ